MNEPDPILEQLDTLIESALVYAAASIRLYRKYTNRGLTVAEMRQMRESRIRFHQIKRDLIRLAQSHS
jgi:hypothetical protein